MSTFYVPEVGERVIPAHVEEKVVTGVLNPLTPGTRIRATLGQTVMVGRVSTQPANYDLIYISLDTPRRTKQHLVHLVDAYPLWIDSGWQFELLGEVSA